jgi:PAS domain S-box-containing protein
LLVEDNLAEARLLQEVLKGTPLNRFSLVHVKRLKEAIAHLSSENVDVILLDLTLPDSTGLESLDAVIRNAPSLPIVVLTNTNDDELAIAAVRHGAQDYLVKRMVNQDVLVRSLRYAIERKHSAEALREANEILEQRVQERTAELAMANTLLKTEIEERQKVQERLTLAQQISKIGTFEWNIQAHEITWSAELEALYGRKSGELNGQFEAWLNTLYPDDRDRIEQEFTQAVERGREFSTEFRILTPAQNVRWISVQSSIFNDANGHPLRMIGIHMDITEKKKLEEQFLRAQRLESLGTLASGIAHDLNNILTPILVVVQLLPLKLPDLSDQNRQMLETLDASARRGAQLVKQILSFTRGVEGKRVSLQVSHLLHEIEKLVLQTLPKSIDIETDIDATLWTVSGDVTQLHQVLMNLCVNARDAMPEGGHLTIQAENRVLDEEQARAYLGAIAGSYVAITISDTGIGMVPEVLDRIFAPFFTTKPIGKGTGLGLSAVLGIVKSHGGFVDVQSQTGNGSTFTVFLPANQSGQDSSASEPSLHPGNQELILIADDEVAIREVARIMLESYNYRVLTAGNGMEAIALFAEHKDEIHCVLMDMMMPEMDGMSAIPLMRRLRSDLPFIAMSGVHSKDTVAQASSRGFQGFLPKPFTIQDLLLILQS